MSLNYGNDVRPAIADVEDDGRMVSTYFFTYKSIPLLTKALPTTILGYPRACIIEELDDDSYIVVRSIVADSDSSNLSGIRIEVELDIRLNSHPSQRWSVDLGTFSLDDFSVSKDFSTLWQINKKFVLKDVILPIETSNVERMYATLGMRAKDASGELGNEWGLSLLLNSPKPSEDF